MMAASRGSDYILPERILLVDSLSCLKVRPVLIGRGEGTNLNIPAVQLFFQIDSAGNVPGHLIPEDLPELHRLGRHGSS